jgi:hypothetical protein
MNKQNLAGLLKLAVKLVSLLWTTENECKLV